MATVILQFKVNAGAVQTGTATVVAEDEIDLLLASYSGLQSIRYEIQAFPDGFAEPSGWSTDGSSGVYFYNANSIVGLTPPTITMPTAAEILTGQWGKWIFRAIATTATGTITSDPRCGVKIVSPTLGLNGIAFTEEDEFDGDRAWPGEIQEDLNEIDGSALAAGIPATAEYVLDTATQPPELPFSIPLRNLANTLNFLRSGAVPATFAHSAAAGSVQEALGITREVTAAGAGTVGTAARVAWRTRNGAAALVVVGAERVELTATSPSAKRVWSTVDAAVESDAMTLHANRTLQLHGYTTAGLLLNNGAGVLSSSNPAVLVNGTFSGVSNAVDITNLSSGLSFIYLAGGPTLALRAADAVTNAGLTVLKLDRYVTGTTQAGTAGDILYALQNDNGDEVEAGKFSVSLTNVGAGTEAAALTISLWSGGAMTPRLLLSDTGALRLHGYTSAGGLVVDGSGNVTSLGFTPASAARTITAGAGLTGGGDLSADRTFDVVAADASITVNSDSIEASGNFTSKNIQTTGTLAAGAGTFTVDDGVTNDVTTVLSVAHTTTGTAANNIAARILIQCEDSAGIREDTAAITGTLTNATSGAEASEIALSTRTGGAALTKKLQIAGDGAQTHTLDNWVSITSTSGSLKSKVESQGRTQTPNNTPVTPWQYTLPASCFGSIVMIVDAQDITAADDFAHYERKYMLKRRNSGAVTLTAVGADVEVETSDTNWDAVIVESGGVLSLQLTGDSANLTDFGGRVVLEITPFTPPP